MAGIYLTISDGEHRDFTDLTVTGISRREDASR